MVTKESIYIDGCKLRKLIRRSQFLMAKADRIIYGTPALCKSGEFLSDFVIAYESRDDQSERILRMIGEFEVLKLDLREIVEDHILKGRDDAHGGLSAETCEIQMFELVSKIDEGIRKWRASVIRKVKSAAVRGGTGTEK